MRKIPTLFVRDEATNRRHVLNEVTPGCEWVLDGEGVATRKFDGTCVLIRDGELFGRREVKAGKTPPDDFELVEHDETTGKSVGWVPVTDGPEWRIHREAYDESLPDGTYELIGPNVNGNPEHQPAHVLVPHGEFVVTAPRDFAGLQVWLAVNDYEGIVWHHPDGRMAKLKRRDFPKAAT
jgi:hypothetical protein